MPLDLLFRTTSDLYTGAKTGVAHFQANLSRSPKIINFGKVNTAQGLIWQMSTFVNFLFLATLSVDGDEDERFEKGRSLHLLFALSQNENEAR
jgi:hypothetical protein